MYYSNNCIRPTELKVRKVAIFSCDLGYNACHLTYIHTHIYQDH